MEVLKQDLNKKNPFRGLIIMGAGLTLLLYTLGIVEKGITTFLIVCALLMIAYGFVKSGFYGMTKRALKEYKKKPARKKPVEKVAKKESKKVVRKK